MNVQNLTSLSSQISALQFVLDQQPHDIIDTSNAGIKDIMQQKIKQYVDQVHHRSFHQQILKHKDGYSYVLWATKNKESNWIRAKSLDDLYVKLYDYYNGKEKKNATLEELFKDFLIWKSKRPVTGKTLQIRKQDWDRYVSHTDIAKRKINDISAKEWLDLFERIIEDYQLDKKAFSAIKSLINGIYKYAINVGLASSNPLAGADYSDLPYAYQEPYHHVKASFFKVSELDKIVAWCRKEMENPKKASLYYLAILFNLYCGLRFGELTAVRWSDYDPEERVLCIKAQNIHPVEMQADGSFKTKPRERVNHLKAYEDFRRIAINDFTAQILEEIKQLNLPGAEIFPIGFIRYNSYNSKVKDLAEYLGYSRTDYCPHALRVTAACIKYKETNSIIHVQRFLGHTSVTMTEKYIRYLCEAY